MALSKNVLNLRKQFRTQFSPVTQKIISGIAVGKTSSEIASTLHLSVGTVGTTKGNLSRGVYVPFAVLSDGNVTGTCQFAG